MFYNRYSFNHHTKFLDPHSKFFQEKNFTYMKQITINTSKTQTLLQFSAPVKVKPIEGLAVLVMFAKEIKETQFVLIDSEMYIKTNVAFNILAIDKEVTVQLLTQENLEPQFIKTENELTIHDWTIDRIIGNLLASETITFQENSYATLSKQSYYNIFIVEDGHMDFTYKNQTFSLSRAQLLILPPHTSITRSHTAKFKTLVHTFKVKDCLVPKQILMKPMDVGSHVAPLLDLMNAREHSDYFVVEILIQLNQLMLNLIQRYHSNFKVVPTTAMREKYDNQLFEAILSYIHTSDIIGLKVNDLVNKFNISRSTLQQLFNKYQHMTPKIYINQLRLEKSRQLIRESDYSITEIANLLGFGSIQYFSRAFSKEYHISPSEYAKGYAKRK